MLELLKQGSRQGVVPWDEIRHEVQQGPLAGIDVLLRNPPHPWPVEMASWAPSIWGAVVAPPAPAIGGTPIRLFTSDAVATGNPTDAGSEANASAQATDGTKESGLEPHIEAAWNCWDAVLERIAGLQENGPACIHPLLATLWTSPLMGITPGQPWAVVAQDLAPGPQRDRIRTWGTRLASLTAEARTWIAAPPLVAGEIAPDAARQLFALAAASPAVAQQVLLALRWVSPYLADHLVWAQPALRLECLLGRLDDAPQTSAESYVDAAVSAATTPPERLQGGEGDSSQDDAWRTPEDAAWERTGALLQQAADPPIWPLAEPPLPPAPRPLFRARLQKHDPFRGDLAPWPRPAGLIERHPDEWWAVLLALGAHPAQRDTADQSALAQYLAQPSSAGAQDLATLRSLNTNQAVPVTASRRESVTGPLQKPTPGRKAVPTAVTALSPNALPSLVIGALRRDRVLGWEILHEEPGRNRLMQGLTQRIRRLEAAAAASIPQSTPTPSEAAAAGTSRWAPLIESSLEPWLGYIEQDSEAPDPQQLDVTGRVWRPSPRAQQALGTRTATVTLHAWKHLIQSLGPLLLHALGTPGRELFVRLVLGHPGETHQVAWPNLELCARDPAVSPLLLWSAWDRLLRGRVMGAHQMALAMPKPWPTGVQPLLATAIGERLRVLAETVAKSPQRMNPVMIEAIPYLSSPVRSVGATLLSLRDGAWPQASGGIAMAQHPLAGRDAACRTLLAERKQPSVWAALICAAPHAPDVEKLLHELLASGEDGVGGLQQVEAHAPELLTAHLSPSHFGPLLASTNAESRLWAIRQIGKFARQDPLTGAAEDDAISPRPGGTVRQPHR